MADLMCPHDNEMIPEGEMVNHLMNEHQMSREDAQKWVDDQRGKTGGQ